MNNKLLEAIRVIFGILAIIMLLIVTGMILMKIFGYSPSETAIIFSVIGILVTLQVIIISVLFQIKEDVGSVKNHGSKTHGMLRMPFY